ncbi:GntR family transcriptional regulator [bacterium]|nr:MAG: GntR family transcriptional regulator [bacterium]
MFEQLKREIVENHLESDTLLTELAVAAGYSVSRAPAREALKRLAAVGFVRPRRRVGYLVTNVSLADLDEIFAMRLVLEPLATELAVGRLTEADAAILKRLAEGVQRVEVAADERGRMITKLNADFHREIARIGGNKRLEQAITRLVDELERVMHMLAYSPTVGSLLEEHSDLLVMMQAGDPKPAGELMRAQLERDYNAMRSLVMRTPTALTLVRPAPES